MAQVRCARTGGQSSCFPTADAGSSDGRDPNVVRLMCISAMPGVWHRQGRKEPSIVERDAAVDTIARAVHETVRAYQAALAEPVAPAWEDAGSMQQDSRDAVEFALGNPTPGAQHEAWVRSKEREGWVYGPVTDENAKTHPSLRPFTELSETEQTKDALLVRIVQALA